MSEMSHRTHTTTSYCTSFTGWPKSIVSPHDGVSAPYWSLTLTLLFKRNMENERKKMIKLECLAKHSRLWIMKKQMNADLNNGGPGARSAAVPMAPSMHFTPRQSVPLYPLIQQHTEAAPAAVPAAAPGPPTANATQPIKEIWAGCSGRANTHIRTHSPTRSMKNEDIRAHKIQLYLSLLLPHSRHLHPFPLHSLFISPRQNWLKVIIHV